MSRERGDLSCPICTWWWDLGLALGNPEAALPSSCHGTCHYFPPRIYFYLGTYYGFDSRFISNPSEKSLFIEPA